MAKKVQKQNTEKLFCRDCKHSYDYHEKGADGKPFLCRCPYFHYSKFLYMDNCQNFEKR